MQFRFHLETYPTGWLVLKLCDIYSVSTFRLSVLIGYKNLAFKMKAKTNFTDDTINKIKEFVNNHGNDIQKQQATKIIKKFISIRVFNIFKKDSYPENTKFKIEDYPAGWVVLKLCEIYLILINRLSLLIDYAGLDKSLAKRQYFTNETVSKIVIFIYNNGTTLQKEQALYFLRKYIRLIVFNLFKTGKYPRLEQFQIEFFPAGWLILRLCEIFLVLPNGLGKLINYSKVNRTLRDKRKFSKNTIRKIKEMVNSLNIIDLKKKVKEALRKFEDARIPKTFNIKKIFELIPNPYLHPIFTSEFHRSLKLSIQLNRCLYTGKKFNSIRNERNFHHIDYNRLNNSKNNLVFINEKIHRQVIHPYNNSKVSKELRENLMGLLNGLKPRNWKRFALRNYEKRLLNKHQDSNYWLIKAHTELEKFLIP